MRIRRTLLGACIWVTMSAGLSTALAATTAGSAMGPMPPQGRHFGGGGFVDYAKIIGISQTTLMADRRAGKSLVQIAATKHMSETTLIAKVKAAEKSMLTAQVKAKKLTVAQEKQMLQRYDARVKSMVEQKGFAGGPRGYGHPRGPGGYGGPGGGNAGGQPPAS